MSSLLPAVVMLAGAGWAFFMLRAMFAILRLAPKGERMRTYNRLSMWNFGAVRADLGPAAEPHLKTMRRGAYVFLALFAAALATAVLTAVLTGNT